MKGNGFGRLEQCIIMKVSASDADGVAKKLDLPFVIDRVDASLVTFEWRRLAIPSELGNDENVVLDLRLELHELADATDWQIDWGTSEY